MSDTKPQAAPLARAKLTQGSVTSHLVGQTAPAIVGVAAIMSIGLVDAYFIGQLGSDALAAIAFIFPISVALSSIGVGVMVGINSVVARALGEGDAMRAARRANFGIIFALMTGVVIGLSLYAALDPLFKLMNAPDHLLALIRAYMEPFALGFPLILVIMGFNGVLRGQGEARKTSMVSISYAAANWVLDPILITGALGFEGYGIAGAAYATIIGYAIGAVVAALLARRADLPLDPSLMKDSHVLDSAGAIMRVAGPAAFSNSINPIGLAILTALIALQGDAAVAGFGAAGRLQSFATVPLLALSGSIGAIVGQNWGAKAYDRARQAALYAFGFCIIWGLGIAAAMVAGGQWFAVMFTDDPAVVAQFSLYLHIAAWGYAGFGVLIIANGILNAVDKAPYALWQSALRVFGVMLPAAWILVDSWGSAAIYSAELAANLFGGLSGAVLIYWVLKRRAPDAG